MLFYKTYFIHVLQAPDYCISDISNKSHLRQWFSNVGRVPASPCCPD